MQFITLYPSAALVGGSHTRRFSPDGSGTGNGRIDHNAGVRHLERGNSGLASASFVCWSITCLTHRAMQHAFLSDMNVWHSKNQGFHRIESYGSMR